MMAADYTQSEEMADYENKFRSNFYMPALKKDKSAAYLVKQDLSPYKKHRTNN